MEKQSPLAEYIKKVVQPSLGFFGILREALKTSIRNGMPLLFIAFIMFSYYSGKELTDAFILLPRLDNLVGNLKLLSQSGSFFYADPALRQEVFKGIRFFLGYEFVVLSFLFIILTFAVVASVHSTSEAYTFKVLNLKEMLLGTKGRWKRALKTSIWMIIISLASAALLYFVVGVVGVMTGGTLPSALNWAFLILGGGYAVYLCSLWTLGLVVSVIEENLSGLKAIIQANELMKGKKLQCFVLTLIMIFAGWTVFLAFCFLAGVLTTNQNATLATMEYFAISIPKKLAYCLLKLFAFVVYTLFYHECKKSPFAKENAALYTPIPAIAEV